MRADENKEIKVLAIVACRAHNAPVKTKTYTTEEVVEMLKRKQGNLTMRQFAEELGISAPYLSDIYQGNRRPGLKVLEKLGLAKKLPAEPVYEVVAS